MQNKLIVKPDKNIFLLYAMLNTLGLIPYKPQPNHLKQMATKHFLGYKGVGLKKNKIHHCQYVYYVLTLGQAPGFLEKKNLRLDDESRGRIKIGSAVRKHLLHFYKNTDFDDFYNLIFPEYQKACDEISKRLKSIEINKILDDIWETESTMKIVVIPTPFESGGIGPYIDRVAYAVIGLHFDNQLLFLIAHEVSHSRADKILQPIKQSIAKKSSLFKIIKQNPNYPTDCYDAWDICFEEHFIRAMHIGFIDSALGIHTDINKELNKEIKKYGMVFIRDFYEEIKKHKESPGKESLKDVALHILERLNKKYN